MHRAHSVCAPPLRHNVCMPEVQRERILDGRGQRLRLGGGEGTVSWADCLHGWQADAGFRARFVQMLAAAPFDAFRWECPPLTTAVLEQPFECALIDAPELAREADGRDFEAHFETTREPILRFSNLGGDAELIVPRPMADTACYPHLAAFVRKAPAEQVDALWRTIGETAAACVSARPVWLSTAGDGVPWLHVRLDARPKYFRHAPYRQPGS